MQDSKRAIESEERRIKIKNFRGGIKSDESVYKLLMLFQLFYTIMKYSKWFYDMPISGSAIEQFHVGGL